VVKVKKKVSRQNAVLYCVLCQYYNSSTREASVAKKMPKRQQTRHPTAESYFKETLTKRKLKMDKKGNTKYIPKKEQGATPNFNSRSVGPIT